MIPGPLLIPGVVLTTFATVIASQAVISGAFALVQQVIPRGWIREGLDVKRVVSRLIQA